MAITDKEARRVLDAAVTKAEELGIRLGFVIVDEHADLVAALRMEGARSPWLMEVVQGKAMATAAWNGQPSAALVERVSNNPTLMERVNQAYGGRLTYLQGAVPLKKGDEIVGAIAGGGARPQQDEEAATAGAEALAG